ncbi:MAG: phytoene/squalene synthase family protein [Chloroflexota bacterium]
MRRPGGLRNPGLPHLRLLPAAGRSAGERDALDAGLNESERFCQELARRKARNFYWGFLALPKQQRVAIYALYGFARQVDDEVDLSPFLDAPSRGDDPFAFHRDRLDRCLTGASDDPVMQVLSKVVPKYQIPRQELEAVICGVEMDLQVRRYESWEDLRQYCLLVASNVGRMCVRIFGFQDPEALTYADDLGLALQLTNILRDVREDLDLGRVYLPQQDLRQFGIREHALRYASPGDGWESLVHHEVQRASDLFESGLRVTELIPRRAAACVLTMSGMYRMILEQIACDPYLPLRQRASLGKRKKLSVMARSWLQAM